MALASDEKSGVMGKFQMINAPPRKKMDGNAENKKRRPNSSSGPLSAPGSALNPSSARPNMAMAAPSEAVDFCANDQAEKNRAARFSPVRSVS